MVSFVAPDDTVLVADGGLATELEARGNDLSDPLWSARLLPDAPDQIRDAHLAFFRAGAVLATSAGAAGSGPLISPRSRGPPAEAEAGGRQLVSAARMRLAMLDITCSANIGVS